MYQSFNGSLHAWWTFRTNNTKYDELCSIWHFGLIFKNVINVFKSIETFHWQDSTSKIIFFWLLDFWQRSLITIKCSDHYPNWCRKYCLCTFRDLEGASINLFLFPSFRQLWLTLRRSAAAPRKSVRRFRKTAATRNSGLGLENGGSTRARSTSGREWRFRVESEAKEADVESWFGRVATDRSIGRKFRHSATDN